MSNTNKAIDMRQPVEIQSLTFSNLISRFLGFVYGNNVSLTAQAVFFHLAYDYSVYFTEDNIGNTKYWANYFSHRLAYFLGTYEIEIIKAIDELERMKIISTTPKNESCDLFRILNY